MTSSTLKTTFSFNIMGALAIIAVALVFAMPSAAMAITYDIDDEPSEAQRRIEESSAAYDAALYEAESLEASIAATEAKIAEVSQKLPEQQARANSALSVLYKMQRNVSLFLELITGSTDLKTFIATYTYLDHIQEKNLAELKALKEMKAELEASAASLDSDKKRVEVVKDEAASALADAQAAREEELRRAQEEAERQAAQQKAAAEIAAQEAQATKQEESASESENAQASASTAEPTVEKPSTEGVGWTSDKETFVNAWAPRIDAYLEGFPLSGQGATFAAAAWDYGVDPRWSPAISNTESTRGLYCFRNHNAWGWGSVDWDSWEEAIYAHVRGLSRGYGTNYFADAASPLGSTITVGAAKKYCPPNWEHWYNATLAEMNKI